MINPTVYYAPEKICNFGKPDKINALQKEAVFSMGMTLVHAALLKDLYGCYDYKNSLFYESKLEEMIEGLNERYSESFIEALASIIEPNPSKRPSLLEVQEILNEKWNQTENQSEKPERETEDLK